MVLNSEPPNTLLSYSPTPEASLNTQGFPSRSLSVDPGRWDSVLEQKLSRLSFRVVMSSTMAEADNTFSPCAHPAQYFPMSTASLAIWVAICVSVTVCKVPKPFLEGERQMVVISGTDIVPSVSDPKGKLHRSHIQSSHYRPKVVIPTHNSKHLVG